MESIEKKNRPVLTLKKPPSANDTASVDVISPATKGVVKKVESKPAVKKPKAVIPPALKLLCQEFPQIFNLKMRKPLKIGIYEDVLVALENHPDITEKSAKKALLYYTRGLNYQLALTKCPDRIDLKGETVGSVDDAAKDYAMGRLKAGLIKKEK